MILINLIPEKQPNDRKAHVFGPDIFLIMINWTNIDNGDNAGSTRQIT